MTINPLNLQVSIPRTPDVGLLQQQAMQKPVVDQTELGQQSLKNTENMRTQTQKTQESEKGVIHDEQGSSQQQGQQQKKKKKNEQQPSDGKPYHPYKGHSIDIKL